MASEERIREILKELHDAVVHYDEDKAAEWARIALDEGVDPFVATMDGLAAAMQKVDELCQGKSGCCGFFTCFIPSSLIILLTPPVRGALTVIRHSGRAYPFDYSFTHHCT